MVRNSYIRPTGQGSTPKEFTSEGSLLDYVSARPGAIGYISGVPEPRPVKVLTITIGK